MTLAAGTRRARRGAAALAGVLGLTTLAGCGLSGRAVGTVGSKIEVVAAENFWGSIAGQLGGDRVHLTSVISNPATDPHAYEAKPSDARIIAGAAYVIANGAGYDPWMPRLLDANPVSSRRVLTVADLVGRQAGDNPHFWYSPDYVDRVVDRITADLRQVRPSDWAYFDQRHEQYRTVALREYHAIIQHLRQAYAGVPAGATESIFAYLAPACGLDLLTPAEYMKAVSEGTDTPAADRGVIDEQVRRRRVKVLVFNSQNSTPEVAAVVAEARAHKVPVVAVTETLSPATATFQDWQTAQLRALQAALGG